MFQVIGEEIPIESDTLTPQTSENNETETGSFHRPQLTLLDGTFFKLVPQSSNSRKIVGTCVKCIPRVVEIKGYNNCTSNFVGHLKRKHGEDAVEEYKNYSRNKKMNTQTTTATGRQNQTKPCRKSPCAIDMRHSQETFDEAIVKYFIHSMISLAAVEDPYFIDMMYVSKDGFKVMTRRSLAWHIQDYYSKQMIYVKNELQSVKYVCTTVDIWPGGKNSFLGLTVHWICRNLSRKSMAIACRRFNGTHSYDRISELLQDIYNDFSLDPCIIVATITDNRANFVEAFKEFGVKLKSEKMLDDSTDTDSSASEDDKKEGPVIKTEEEEDYDAMIEVELDPSDTLHNNVVLPSHIRCCAHTLSLCATFDANKILRNKNTELSKMHEQVINKCNALWNAGAHPKSAEIIENILGHSLKRPCETRWNNLQDALKQILSIREKSDLLHSSLNIVNSISDMEFEYIQEYLLCVAPVAEALDMMQGETAKYHSFVVPALLALRRKLQKLRRIDYMWCNDLTAVYLRSVERRFNEFFSFSSLEAENAVIAALSHPRFKNKWFSCIEDTHHSRLMKLFETAISKEIIEKPKKGNYYKASINSERETEFFSFDSDSEGETLVIAPPKSKAELLVSHYLADDGRDVEILERHPEVRNVFIRYNTPLPSSASIERLLSYETMTNISKYRKLSGEMIEKRVVLKANLRYENEKNNSI